VGRGKERGTVGPLGEPSTLYFHYPLKQPLILSVAKQCLNVVVAENPLFDSPYPCCLERSEVAATLKIPEKIKNNLFLTNYWCFFLF
jgi:hypothetical protein